MKKDSPISNKKPIGRYNSVRIEKNIPIPTEADYSWVRKMEIGDSILVDTDDKIYVLTGLKTYMKKHKLSYTFISRIVDEDKDSSRIWRKS